MHVVTHLVTHVVMIVRTHGNKFILVGYRLWFWFSSLLVPFYLVISPYIISMHYFWSFHCNLHLPALIVTLHNIYDDSGDAEEYELHVALALSSYSWVATIHFLSVVLDLLAKLKCFMQRNATDFIRLPTILKRIVLELKHSL